MQKAELLKRKDSLLALVKVAKLTFIFIFIKKKKGGIYYYYYYLVRLCPLTNLMFQVGKKAYIPSFNQAS